MIWHEQGIWGTQTHTKYKSVRRCHCRHPNLSRFPRCRDSECWALTPSLRSTRAAKIARLGEPRAAALRRADLRALPLVPWRLRTFDLSHLYIAATIMEADSPFSNPFPVYVYSKAVLRLVVTIITWVYRVYGRGIWPAVGVDRMIMIMIIIMIMIMMIESLRQRLALARSRASAILCSS